VKVIVTGGGTGGHIYPALAIAKGLQEAYNNCEILYVGTQKGLEANILPKTEFNYKFITVDGLPRRINLESLKSGIKLIKGLGQSFKIISDFKPDAIVATGGYVAGPIGWVGSQMGVPLLIHEQNSYPGITNKLLASKAKKICLTFEDSKKYFKDKSKLMVTGLPVRSEILNVCKKPSHKKTVLITGGSRGAQSINNAVIQAMPEMIKMSEVNFIFITGETGYENILDILKKQGINIEVKGNITIKPYMYNIEDALSVADLVIGRAGATFLAEITALGIPAILAPYPYATENHQEHNAESLVKKGAAILISDADLNGQKLFSKIDECLKDSQRMEIMREASQSLGKPQALEQILDVFKEMLKSN